jgi:hypothetical protein
MNPMRILLLLAAAVATSCASSPPPAPAAPAGEGATADSTASSTSTSTSTPTPTPTPTVTITSQVVQHCVEGRITVAQYLQLGQEYGHNTPITLYLCGSTWTDSSTCGPMH